MKFAEAIGALLINGNGWANTSLIQSDPLLCLLHLLSMTVKQSTQSVTHVLIGFLSLIINHFMELRILARNDAIFAIYGHFDL